MTKTVACKKCGEIVDCPLHVKVGIDTVDGEPQNEIWFFCAISCLDQTLGRQWANCNPRNFWHAPLT